MSDKTCNRCGTCCTVIPLFTQHMHPDYRKYLLNRGLVEDKEQGCILIPHVCQHLMTDKGNPIVGPAKIMGEHDEIPVADLKYGYSCAIHNSPERPAVCGKFHGQKMIKGARFYVPPNCSYREDS